MTTIELKYDAFNIKTILTVNGTEKALRCFGTGRETLLREWIDDFFPDLIKSCNLGAGSECTVQFFGTQSDFEDVTNAYSEYQKQNEGIKIEFPPYIRYPQSLSEIREYTDNKQAGYEAEIIAKKVELEKANTAIEEENKAAEEEFKVTLDELETKLDRAGEILEHIFQKEFEKIKAGIAEIRQEADLEFLKKRRNTEILKTEIQKVLKRIVEMISEYTSKCLDSMCKNFSNESERFLSGFLSVVKTIPHIKIIVNNNYSTNKTFEENVYDTPIKISSPIDNIFGFGIYRALNSSKTRYHFMLPIEILAYFQKLINDTIDSFEQHCIETLTIIRASYFEEMKPVISTIKENIAKQKENPIVEPNVESVSFKSRIAIMDTMQHLEAKSECFVELAAEINRIEEGSK